MNTNEANLIQNLIAYVLALPPRPASTAAEKSALIAAANLAQITATILGDAGGNEKIGRNDVRAVWSTDHTADTPPTTPETSDTTAPATEAQS